jgi:hypothetical protein
VRERRRGGGGAGGEGEEIGGGGDEERSQFQSKGNWQRGVETKRWLSSGT